MAHEIVFEEGEKILYRDGEFVVVENEIALDYYSHALADVSGVVVMYGLGLATGIKILIDNPAVTTIYVVELYQDLIDFIKLEHPKVSYINADAREFVYTGNDADWCIADIWSEVTHETIREGWVLARRSLDWAGSARNIPAFYAEYVNGAIRTT